MTTIETVLDYKKTLDGEYDFTGLDRLTWPAAWSATVPQDERDRFDAARRELAQEAKDQLQIAYDNSDADNAQYKVVISDGVVAEVVPA